ncbi:type VI secretion system baseplate subunit TssE [Pantoea sp.]|uniref:type VI secretion system baseplate subunit TssE n=1 Tax=Pantoea sp. TaxID=69393 RepID=UPI002897935A|nr:GPW/gp25 family protein [Pantoea sp.]
METKRQFSPTLLDRLLDEQPKAQREVFDQFFINANQMRAIVLRDVLAILNTTNIEDRLEADRHYDVAGSVINYGVRAVTGTHPTQHDWRTTEKNFREAILRFEPRIIPESLRVALPDTQDRSFKNGMLLFEVYGLIYWDPYPIDLAAKFLHDRENDKVILKQI